MAINPCDNYIEVISPDECLHDSLAKINNNFLNLEEVVCDLKHRVNKIQAIRTFFYYGPNSETYAGSGMADNEASRPSNLTIRAFVNSPTQLNLPAISKPNDIAYVVYQKTGYLNSLRNDVSPEYTYDRVADPADISNSFAPIFIIWRLTFTTNDYQVDVGYPRFSQAQTANDINWNQPQTWTTYSS